MKLRIFLDTNVLLDVLLERPGYETVLEILQWGADGKASLCVSFLSMANIAYVLRKDQNGLILSPTLKQISVLTEVLPMDQAQLQRALLLAGPDFEDILQAVCAESGHCSAIITRNPKDFQIQKGLCPDWQPPAILTPEAFVSSI
ncbi:MAG: PIN domain-containing protein [Bacteroidales bacterium]|nr:PIN domain-containing protein [Bacteroidales bacterium]